MVSGVPQSTVLDPLLFLLNINDLPSVVSSKVRLFADDLSLFKVCLVLHPACQLDANTSHTYQLSRQLQSPIVAQQYPHTVCHTACHWI